MPPPEPGLNILVADDSRTDVAIVSAMLARMGHSVIESRSGEEALNKFCEYAPDMVLIDVNMPGIGGIETVRKMRQITRENWIPIIFVTGVNGEEDIVRGIDAGGDDYLLKPVHFKILRAKIDALYERLRMFRQMKIQSQLLLDYQARTEAEQMAAQEFMVKLLALDKIDDPLVQFQLQPAEIFSGDLIAIARSPTGLLYAMLADSSGHGLTAALAVTPVLQTFHSMAEKGFSLGALAAEINRKIGNYLPAHRFVAAALVVLDQENNRLSVWNGGCPPVILLEPDDTIACRFDSMHLPLGILNPQDFDDKVAHYHYGDRHCQLFIYSDGAVDCLDSTSASNGVTLLIQAATSASPENRLSHMMRLIQQSNWKQAGDDIALILIDCPPTSDTTDAVADSVPVVHEPVITATDALPPEDSSPSEVRADWKFELALSARQLRQSDIVPLLLHVVRQVDCDNFQELSSKLFLVLSELFNNALDHGVLGLDSSLKNAQNMDHYFDERMRRLEQLEKGEIRIQLMTFSRHGSPCLEISITDSGKGFDFEVIRQGASPSDTRRHGRGIALVESMSGRLCYADGGRTAYACIPLHTLEQCAASHGEDSCGMCSVKFPAHAV